MEHNIFKCDDDFCSECGAILRLPKSGFIVKCAVCKHERSIKSLMQRKTSFTINFTPMGYHSNIQEKQAQKDDEEESYGQMDTDRECSKCKHKGMSYTTMQLRSADEGQTVFYLCPQCKHREVENS